MPPDLDNDLDAGMPRWVKVFGILLVAEARPATRSSGSGTSSAAAIKLAEACSARASSRARNSRQRTDSSQRPVSANFLT